MTQSLIDTVNSTVRTLGLLASGGWIAFTFWRLQKTREAETGIAKSLADTEKARAESEKALADARKSAAEQEKISRDQRSLQPNLRIEFSSIVTYPRADGRLLLAVTVDIGNPGARNMRLDFKGSAVTLGKFDLSDDHMRRMQYVKRVMPTRMHSTEPARYDIGYRIFRVNQERHLVFLIPIEEPGLHILEFNAEYYDIPFDKEVSQPGTRHISAIHQKIVNINLESPDEGDGA